MASQGLISTASIPPQFLKAVFMVGHVPLKALSSEPRVSYSMYVPAKHYNPNPTSSPPTSSLPLLPLLVSIHGTGRDLPPRSSPLYTLCDSSSSPCALLTPLFPCGLDSAHDLDSYKVLSSRTLRSDLALLSILEEVAQRWPGIDTSKVFLMGFSGGGQFTHRFLYLYPERLFAASVGAPGSATGLSSTKRWPAGVGGTEELFGRKVDRVAISRLKIMLVVGGDDHQVHGGEGFWEWQAKVKAMVAKQAIEQKDDRPEIIESENDATKSCARDKAGLDVENVRTGRVETLEKLHEEWKNAGIESKFVIVPGVAHDSDGVLKTNLDFFERLLQEYCLNSKTTMI